MTRYVHPISLEVMCARDRSDCMGCRALPLCVRELYLFVGLRFACCEEKICMLDGAEKKSRSVSPKKIKARKRGGGGDSAIRNEYCTPTTLG